MTAFAVPMSRKTSMNPVMTAAMPTRPKSDGASSRARTIFVNSDRPRLPKCETEDHFTPDVADDRRDCSDAMSTLPDMFLRLPQCYSIKLRTGFGHIAFLEMVPTCCRLF